MQRLAVPLVAALTVAALLTPAAGARNPGGRDFNGAIFSAGVSGEDGPNAKITLSRTPSLDALVRVSTDNGVTAPLSPEELTTSGRVFIDSQTEPWVDVNPRNTRNVVGFWQEDRWSSGGARNLVFGTSFDGGRTWANIPLQGIGIVAGGEFQRVTDPWLDFGPENRVHATSLAFDDTGPDNAIFVHTSHDGGLTWPVTATVILDTEFKFFNDKQALVADDFASSPHRGNVYVAWDRLIEDPLGVLFLGTFTGPAMFSRSTDGGVTFSTPQVIFDTPKNKQTIGNVPVALPNGTVVVGGTFFENLSFGKNSAKFWVTRSTDGGATFAPPELVDDIKFLYTPNVRAGDFLPSLAVDRATGRVYATWQDSRFSGGKRNDVLVTHSDDAGRTWSMPVKANDTPAGAQGAFTPAVQVSSDGRVGVLYYDLRDDTSTRDSAILTTEWLAVSTDGGSTFGASMRITPTFDQTAAAFAGGFFLGDYQALGNAGRGFQPFFVANLVAQASGDLGSDVFSTRVR